MTRHRSAILRFVVAAGAATACTPALAWDGAAVTFFTAQLEQRQGTLIELNDARMRIRDANERVREIPLDQIAAIFFELTGESGEAPLPTPSLLPSTTPAGQGLLITTDNQRLRGRPIVGEPGPESVLWDGPPFGPRVFPLESLRALRPGSGGPVILEDKPTTDVIIFKNADRAPTFVESIVAVAPKESERAAAKPDAPGDDLGAIRRRQAAARAALVQRRTSAVVTGVVRADVRDVPADIPLERIQAITFANPPVRPLALPRIWLSDTSVVAAASFSITPPRDAGAGSLRRLGDSQLQLDSAGEVVMVVLTPPQSGPGSVRPDRASTPAPDANGRVPLRSVLALATDASNLLPLSSCKIQSAALPGMARRWTPPARIDAARSAPLDAYDIVLPGPMVATIDLPVTATHIGGTVELPLASRPLASCRVNVAIVDAAGGVHEITSADLSYRSPSVAIAAPVPPGASGPFRLRVTLTSGDDGPVQDAVVLRRFLAMVTD